MKPRCFVFGLGYTAKRIATALEARGWKVVGTGRDGQLSFDDHGGVRLGLADASHVLSSVPPGGDGVDPVLDRYGDALTGKRWIGYLSSTGVYGDTRGAWVDESAMLVGHGGGTGRRSARSEADLAWQALGARVFRLPGIYGPGRSVFERIAAGTAQRIDQAGQVFSRVHVDDIVSGVLAALDAPPGAYNLADDRPASQNTLIEAACRLLGRDPPPLLTLEQAALSSTARAFYAENRRVANGKARRVLGWVPRFPGYREGLASLRAV